MILNRRARDAARRADAAWLRYAHGPGRGGSFRAWLAAQSQPALTTLATSTATTPPAAPPRRPPAPGAEVDALTADEYTRTVMRARYGADGPGPSVSYADAPAQLAEIADRPAPVPLRPKRARRTTRAA